MSPDQRPSRQPSQLRGRRTIDRLLSAALEVYAERGLEGFTLTAVIAASGVSNGSVYHHFGDFEGLAAALYSRCLGELLDSLVAALQGGPEARDGICALVESYLRFTEQHRPAAHFIHASSYADFLPAHAPVIAAAKAPRIDALLAWLRPHVAAGRVVDLPAWLVEMLLIGPVAETARRWLAEAPGIDLALAARLLPERIWRSLRAD
jgi:AcrR family transcriptional regulator